MMKVVGLTLGAAALSLSVLVAAPSTDKQTQKMQKVDLSEMRDGETRTLGKGDASVTATRKGDIVTITYGDHEGGKKTLKCTLGKDSCYAVTVDGSGKGQMVLVDKSDKGNAEPDRVVIRDGGEDGKGIFVVSGDSDGTPHQVIVDAMHPGMTWVTTDDVDSIPGVNVVRIKEEGATLLECPEGDATLTLKKGEENSGPYFCPKHNVKMEKASQKVIVKKVVVDTKSKDDKDDAE